MVIGGILHRLVFPDKGKLVKSINMTTKNLLDGIPHPGYRYQSLDGHRYPLLRHWVHWKTWHLTSQLSHRHRDEFLRRQSTVCCRISKSSEASKDVDEVFLTITLV